MKLIENAHYHSVRVFSNLENRFNLKHKHKYNYDKVLYVNNNTLITITCPIHGDFEQKPSDHLQGNGCQICGELQCRKSKTIPILKVIEKANKVHNNRYTYTENINYINNNTSLEVICDTHGKFEISMTSHLKGSGCNKCAIEFRARKLSITYKEFVEKAKIKHLNFYTYPTEDSKYTSLGKSKVLITCPIHKNFTQLAKDHLDGSGCKYCAWSNKEGNGGFKFDKPGMLYYFKVSDGINIAWKIGITNLSIEKRYSSKERYKFSNIVTFKFLNGKDAYDIEQKILKENKKHLYTGVSLLESGNTELFNKDVLYGRD